MELKCRKFCGVGGAGIFISLNSVVLVSPEPSAVQIPHAQHHDSPKQAGLSGTHLAGSLVISQPSFVELQHFRRETIES